MTSFAGFVDLADMGQQRFCIGYFEIIASCKSMLQYHCFQASCSETVAIGWLDMCSLT